MEYLEYRTEETVPPLITDSHSVEGITIPQITTLGSNLDSSSKRVINLRQWDAQHFTLN